MTRPAIDSARIRNAWAGRISGCQLGKAVEVLSITRGREALTSYLRQAHEVPVVTEQPEVRRRYARMLIDRDAPGDPSTGSGRDRDRARELLTEAIAMYRRIGMPEHIEMAEALLSEM